MGMYTMPLMGLIDAYAGNLEDSLEKMTVKYRVSTGRKMLLDNAVLKSLLSDAASIVSTGVSVR